MKQFSRYRISRNPQKKLARPANQEVPGVPTVSAHVHDELLAMGHSDFMAYDELQLVSECLSDVVWDVTA